MKKVKCSICGNQDSFTLLKIGKHVVCRKCIHYIRDALLMQESKHEVNIAELELPFALSGNQKRCGHEVAMAISNGNDVLLEAVCGAGKTEMLYESIQQTLLQGGKVGFLIPRRQVVLEVAKRLASVFVNAKVVAVCGGHQDDLYGDIIVATTHQAVRYPHWFDLLILDEPDAFPYKDDEVLEAIVLRSKKNRMIYSTATPSDQLMKMVEANLLKKVELNSRYTNKPMAVPKKIVGPKLYLWITMIRLILNRKRSVLIFVPTISLAKQLYLLLNRFIDCNYATSKTENKEEIIEAFRDKKFPVLISTSILERGVTFIDIDVIILYAQHPVFDKAGLIQMAGRVGRSPIYTQGDCWLLCQYQSEKVNQCIERILYANQSLLVV